MTDPTNKKDSPKKETPGKDSPKKDSPQKETLKKGSSKKDSPKKDSPKKETPKKDTPRKGSSRKDSPKKDSPKKEASRKDTPRGSEAGWRLGRLHISPRMVFCALLGLFVVLRVAHSLTAVASFDDEDGYTLAAAFELLGEHQWPYQAYLLSDWENGTLLVVLLAVPFCWLFGPCLFALKMTGLTVSCITFTGLYLLCKESFGVRAGLFVLLIYIFFPNPVYGYSVTAHGFHPDSMALQLPFLWWLVKIYKRRAPTRSHFFFLGALGGFAVYFAYISVFVVAAGVLPWLWLSIRKRAPRGRFRLASFIGGLFVGSIPLLVYNVFNGFLGFNVYHGQASVYFTPTELAAKVQFFQEYTMRALLYFSNPFDPHSSTFGVFEKAFWGVALAAVLLPLAFRLVRRLRKKPATDSPWGGRYIDAVIPLFVILTLAIFFNSRHPVGPAHIIPMLLLLFVGIAGRLGVLWERGRMVGKVAAALLVIGLLAVGGPRQLDEIKPERLGSGLVMDGRNYPLFFFRALNTLEGSGLKHKEHGARHLLLALPPELSLDNKDYIHADHSPAFPRHEGPPPNWDAVLGRYLTEPSGTDIKLDKSASVGLALARLFQRIHPPGSGRRHASLDQLMKFVARYDEAKAGTMLEILGFNLGPRHDLLSPLRKHMASKPAAEQRRLEQRVAFGMGRATFLPAYFESPSTWCEHEKLPQTLQPFYIKGLGHAVATRMIAPVPRWVEDNLCPARRAQFWQGVKLAAAPSHNKLARTNQITDLQ